MPKPSQSRPVLHPFRIIRNFNRPSDRITKNSWKSPKKGERETLNMRFSVSTTTYKNFALFGQVGFGGEAQQIDK